MTGRQHATTRRWNTGHVTINRRLRRHAAGWEAPQRHAANDFRRYHVYAPLPSRRIQRVADMANIVTSVLP